MPRLERRGIFSGTSAINDWSVCSHKRVYVYYLRKQTIGETHKLVIVYLVNN